MKKINKSVLILLIVMTILSFANILNIKINGEVLKLAGISVIVGVIAYFTTRKTNEFITSGLDIKKCFSSFKDVKVILLTITPALLDILCFIIAKNCLPEYIEHLSSRTSFIDSSETIKTILMLAVAALGEEIAWRAFFQKQTTKIVKFIPSLIITSILFSLGHFNFDNPLIVIYDLAFILINSIFYGLVFKKTDNAWCSWISHFIANVIGIFMI